MRKENDYLRDEFTEQEMEKLNKLLDLIEVDAYLPFRQQSGGFSETEVFDYDEDRIDIMLTYGVQDVGSGGQEYTEQLEINRKTMEIIN